MPSNRWEGGWRTWPAELAPISEMLHRTFTRSLVVPSKASYIWFVVSLIDIGLCTMCGRCHSFFPVKSAKDMQRKWVRVWVRFEIWCGRIWLPFRFSNSAQYNIGKMRERGREREKKTQSDWKPTRAPIHHHTTNIMLFMCACVAYNNQQCTTTLLYINIANVLLGDYVCVCICVSGT